MKRIALRKRAVIAAAIAVGLFLIVIFTIGPWSEAVNGTASEPALNPISVTKTSVLVPVGDGNADPGETIEHTVIIGNGGTPATNVQFTDVLQSITTLSGTVAVSPIAVNDTFSAVGNVGINVPDGAGDLLSNDTNPGAAGTLTIISPPTTSVNGGNVSINTTTGAFTYNPAPGFEGSDSFTYTLGNGSGLTDTATVTINVSGMIWFVQNGAAACTLRANGCGRLSNPYSTLAAFQLENNGGAGGLNPSANDSIFLYENATAYTGGVTLLTGQRLIGQDSNSTLASIAGVTVPTFSNPLPVMNTGGSSTLIQNAGGNGVTLGSGNNLNGFTASNSSGFAILGSSFGTVTITDVIINTTGAGLSLTTGTFSGTGFSSFNSTGGTNNVTLTGVAGTIALGGGAMSGSTGTAFNVSGGTAATTYSGTLAKTLAGNLVLIASHSNGNITLSGNLTCNTSCAGISATNNTSGTILFSGGTKTLNTGASTAVNLATNTGTTIDFTNGGLVIDTTTATAFDATGGGTVTVQGTGNTINATNGPANTSSSMALNVNATTIGAGGMTFRSIASGNGTAAADPVNGIVLNTTGSSGGLTVAGNLGNCTNADPTCTGGTIQNTTGDGIELVSTRDVSLTRHRILNAGGEGVDGTGVVNFTFANSLNIGTGDADNEDAFDFGDLSATNITGTLSITNSEVRLFTNDGLVVRNISGSLSITLTNNTFFDNDGTFGVNAALIESLSAATTNLNVTGNTFDKIEGPAIQFEAEGTGGTHDVNIIGNTFSHPTANTNFEVGGGVILIVDTVAGNPAELTFDVQGNYFNLISGIPVNVVGLGNATGRIGGDTPANQSGPGAANQGNGIRQAGSSNGCAEDAVRLDFDGNFNPPQSTVNATWTILVKQNFIDQHNGVDVGGDLCPGRSGDQGVVVFNRDHPGTLNATIDSNTIIDTLNQAYRGFYADRDGVVTNGPNANIALTNNVLTNTQSAQPISASVDDLADVCMNVSANSGTGLTAGGKEIFLERRVVGSVLQVPQANAAAISAANAGTPVNITPSPQALSFGVNCSVPLPTNPFAGPPSDGAEASTETTQLLGITAPSPSINNQWASILAPASSILEGGLPSEPSITAPAPSITAAAPEMTQLPSETADGLAEMAETKMVEPGTSNQEIVSAFLDTLAGMISPTVHSQEKPSAPEGAGDVNVGPFGIPANESVTIKFSVTVNNGPYASGVNNITNTATVTADGGVNMNSNTTSIPLDAAPDLVVTKTEGGGTTQPGAALVYTLSYSNATATNGQDAANVVLTETVPANTTFNAAASLPSVWSCANGSAAGTSCTINIGSLAANANGTATFAVNVPAALPVGATQVSNTSSIAENPNVNGTDRVPGDNSGPDTTNIIGNWLGTTSADWNTPSNWSNNTVPPTGNNISVPNVVAPPAFAPSLNSGTVTIGLLSLNKNLSIGNGAVLSATGNVALNTSVVDGLGTLELGTASAITHGVGGQVNATLKKNFAAGPLPMFEMPVGTTGTFSPLFVTVTSGSGQLTVKANTGVPVTVPPLDTTKMLQRYWTLSGSGITSNLTFQYLQTDVPGTTNEALWYVIRVTGNTSVRYPPGPDIILNNAANTFTVNNISVYSHWTAGEPLAPTAANVGVSGRVLDANGRGVYGAQVLMQDQAGNTAWAITNPFGYYRFVNVQVGQSYMFAPRHKRYEFQPRSVTVNDDLTDVNFMAEP